MSDEESGADYEDNASIDHEASDGDGEGPTALAQVMANILASSKEKKEKKEAILSKIPEDKKLDEKTEQEKALLRMKREAKRKRQLAKIAWERMGMVKPSITEKDRERNYAKIATKGVVQLFNAVAAQQERLRSKLSEDGTTDLKRTKIVNSLSRSSFIDLLKSQSGVKNVKSEVEEKRSSTSAKKEPKTEKQQPKWKTLHDDFVLSEFSSGLGAGAENDGERIKPEPRHF